MFEAVGGLSGCALNTSQSVAAAIDEVMRRLMLLLKKTMLEANANLPTRQSSHGEVSPAQSAPTAMSKHASVCTALQREEAICVLSFALFLLFKSSKYSNPNLDKLSCKYDRYDSKQHFYTKNSLLPTVRKTSDHALAQTLYLSGI